MEHEEHVKSLKEILADAMFIGSLSADTSFQGHLNSPENEEWVHAVKALYDKVARFLNALELEGVTARDVFPLHHEIEELTKI